MEVSEILVINKERKAALEAGRFPEGTGEGALEFEEWCRSRVKIKPKGGGGAVAFELNNPQRRLVAALDAMRAAGEPMRLILLKARQWGGSTCVQMYMAWLQITKQHGLNSLIIAHQISASEEIRDMFERLVAHYGDDSETLTLRRQGRSGATYKLAERDCKITIGSAERPDARRGGDYNLVHLSEVGLWKQTKGKRPEDIVQAATSGVLYRPDTMIVMESTANGAGTYFHREYLDAKEGTSQFRALFIPWYEIENYRLPPADEEAFARRLIEERESTLAGTRFQSGAYHWRLWERGATLEAINWYMSERRKYADHGSMAAEYPSDDVEAFVHSGQRVFDPEAIERLRREVREPIETAEDGFGIMEYWRRPPSRSPGAGRPAPDRGRYMVVVDVGGRSRKADWSVIAVFDRKAQLPEIVAQWRGHIDHDLLADKAAEIGREFGGALLVIESNTLETRDREREVDGLQAPFILRSLEDSYPNLYYRPSGSGARPGFHTNSSTKPMVIGTLVKRVREGTYIERDRKAIEELIQYERKPNGTYGAYTGCHDDILMTRAIGLYLIEFS